MTSDYELAKMLFPKPRDIVREATAGTPKTSQVRGVATGDSSDGSVTVILDTVAGGDNAEMTIPTTGGITEGSDVIVTLLDGTPIEVDQPGSIDNANVRIDVLPDQIISTVSQTYATKDEALNTASGSGRSITTTDAAGLPLRDLTVYGESVQEGTPTPDAPVPIRTVSGVNLLDEEAEEHTGEAWSAATARDLDGRGVWPGISRNGYFNDWKKKGNIPYTCGSGTITMTGEGGGYGVGVEFPVKPSTRYTLSYECSASAGSAGVGYYGSDRKAASNVNFTTTRTVTFTTPTTAAYAMIVFSGAKNVETSFTEIMLVEGSATVDYIPYGTIDIGVTHDGTETVTPIDLQGNALASLPDGTRDVLHVENGRAWIDAATAITTTATTDGITATVGVDAMSTTGDLSDGATVIYKLATPSTIDLGEVSLPTVQDGDTVRVIAEVAPVIDGEWWRDTAIVDYTAQNETRITQTEADVTTAVTTAQSAQDAVDSISTIIRQYSDGVLVCKTNNTVGALVNANGSFDVVSVTWSGTTPTAGDVLASFDADEIKLAASTQNATIDMLNGAAVIQAITTFLAGADRTSFGIKSNDVALYGDNTIVLQIGDVPESGGTAEICGFSVRKNIGSSVQYLNAPFEPDGTFPMSGAQLTNLIVNWNGVRVFTTGDMHAQNNNDGRAIKYSPDVLFSNENASLGNEPTLNDTLAGYNRARIYAKDNNGYVTSVDVVNPDGKYINVSTSYPDTSELWTNSTTYLLNGASITISRSGNYELIGNISQYNNKQIAITRVEAWIE